MNWKLEEELKKLYEVSQKKQFIASKKIHFTAFPIGGATYIAILRPDRWVEDEIINESILIEGVSDYWIYR